MFARGISLAIPDVDPTPQDGYAPMWSAALGRAVWKATTSTLPNTQVAYGTGTGIAGDGGLTYVSGTQALTVGGILTSAGLACTAGATFSSAVTITNASTGLFVNLTTDATAASTGAVQLAGGMYVAKSLWVAGSLYGLTAISLGSAPATNRALNVLSGTGAIRWQWFLGDSTAESGSNAGTNFKLTAYDDSGVSIDNPLTLIRAAGGAFTSPRPWSFTGQARFGQSGSPSAQIHIRQSTDVHTAGIRFERAAGTDYQEIFIGPGIGSLSDALQFYTSFSTAVVAAISRDGIGYFSSKLLIGSSTDDGASTLQVNGAAKLASVAAPSLVNGQLWNDSTQGCIQTYQQAVKQTIGTCIGATADIATIANSSAETTLISGSIIGTKTTPANFFVAGKHIRIEIHGYYASLATPGNLTIRVKIGSVTLQTLTITDLKASQTTAPFSIVAFIFCQAAGSSGNFGAAGAMTYTGSSGTSFGLLATTGGVTVNTTISNAVDVTAQFATASASNTIRTAINTITVLN